MLLSIHITIKYALSISITTALMINFKALLYNFCVLFQKWMGVMGRVSEAHKNLDIDCFTHGGLYRYLHALLYSNIFLSWQFFMHIKLCISLNIIITYVYLDINTLYFLTQTFFSYWHLISKVDKMRPQCQFC